MSKQMSMNVHGLERRRSPNPQRFYIPAAMSMPLPLPFPKPWATNDKMQRPKAKMMFRKPRTLTPSRSHQNSEWILVPKMSPYGRIMRFDPSQDCQDLRGSLFPRRTATHSCLVKAKALLGNSLALPQPVGLSGLGPSTSSEWFHMFHVNDCL